MNKYYFDVKLFGYVELEVVADNLLHANELVNNFLVNKTLLELITKNNIETITINESIIDIHPNIKDRKLIKKR